ncbi:MAG: hypothetical protein ABI836_15460 [Gemmatimonadota bacterium]
MSGHVFHPGHHELHGITVVLRTTDQQILVGRFDSVDAAGVRMLGVSAFDAARDGTAPEFLARTNKFGIRVDRPQVTINNAVVASITPLSAEPGTQ